MSFSALHCQRSVDNLCCCCSFFLCVFTVSSASFSSSSLLHSRLPSQDEINQIMETNLWLRHVSLWCMAVQMDLGKGRQVWIEPCVVHVSWGDLTHRLNSSWNEAFYHPSIRQLAWVAFNKKAKCIHTNVPACLFSAATVKQFWLKRGGATPRSCCECWADTHLCCSCVRA